MSHDEAEDIKHHVRNYIRVFVALMILTLVTVTVSYLHVAVPLAITIALAIAIAKGSLVAAVFMHLSAERKIIYASLGLTVVFFVVLMGYLSVERFVKIGTHAGPFDQYVVEGVSHPVH